MWRGAALFTTTENEGKPFCVRWKIEEAMALLFWFIRGSAERRAGRNWKGMRRWTINGSIYKMAYLWPVKLWIRVVLFNSTKETWSVTPTAPIFKHHLQNGSISWRLQIPISALRKNDIKAAEREKQIRRKFRSKHAIRGSQSLKRR